MDEVSETGLQHSTRTNWRLLKQIADIINHKKELEEQEKAEIKVKVKEAMEKYNIKKFESDILNITYVAESTKTSIDSAKLKKENILKLLLNVPSSKTSAYVKVT